MADAGSEWSTWTSEPTLTALAGPIAMPAKVSVVSNPTRALDSDHWLAISGAAKPTLYSSIAFGNVPNATDTRMSTCARWKGMRSDAVASSRKARSLSCSKWLDEA